MIKKKIIEFYNTTVESFKQYFGTFLKSKKGNSNVNEEKQVQEKEKQFDSKVKEEKDTYYHGIDLNDIKGSFFKMGVGDYNYKRRGEFFRKYYADRRQGKAPKEVIEFFDNYIMNEELNAAYLKYYRNKLKIDSYSTLYDEVRKISWKWKRPDVLEEFPQRFKYVNTLNDDSYSLYDWYLWWMGKHPDQIRKAEEKARRIKWEKDPNNHPVILQWKKDKERWFIPEKDVIIKAEENLAYTDDYPAKPIDFGYFGLNPDKKKVPSFYSSYLNYKRSQEFGWPYLHILKRLRICAKYEQYVHDKYKEFVSPYIPDPMEYVLFKFILRPFRKIILKIFGKILDFLLTIYEIIRDTAKFIREKVLNPIEETISQFTYAPRYIFSNYIYPYICDDAIRWYLYQLSRIFLRIFVTDKEAVVLLDKFLLFRIRILMDFFCTENIIPLLGTMSIVYGLVFFHLYAEEKKFRRTGFEGKALKRFNDTLFLVTREREFLVNYMIAVFLIQIQLLYFFNPHMWMCDIWTYHEYVHCGRLEYAHKGYDHPFPGGRYSKATEDVFCRTYIFPYKDKKWVNHPYYNKNPYLRKFYILRYKVRTPVQDYYSYLRKSTLKKAFSRANSFALYRAYVEQWENKALAWRCYKATGFRFANPGSKDIYADDNVDGEPVWFDYVPDRTAYSTLLYRPGPLSPYYMGANPNKSLKAQTFIHNYHHKLKYYSSKLDKYRVSTHGPYMHYNYFWFDFPHPRKIWEGGKPGHYKIDDNHSFLRLVLEFELHGLWFSILLKSNDDLYKESICAQWLDEKVLKEEELTWRQRKAKLPLDRLSLLYRSSIPYRLMTYEKYRI